MGEINGLPSLSQVQQSDNTSSYQSEEDYENDESIFDKLKNLGEYFTNEILDDENIEDTETVKGTLKQILSNIVNKNNDESNEKANDEAINKKDEVKNACEKMSEASSKDEREAAKATFQWKSESADLSKEEYIESFGHLLDAVAVSQAAEMSEFSEMLKNANSDETREIINYQAASASYDFESEYKNYEIEYNQLFSNLPEEQSSTLLDLYQDLADANSRDERDSALALIKEKQEEYNLSDEELSLSNEQITNSLIASCTQTISDLYSELSECCDENTKESIKAEIEANSKVYSALQNRKENIKK